MAKDGRMNKETNKQRRENKEIKRENRELTVVQDNLQDFTVNFHIPQHSDRPCLSKWPDAASTIKFSGTRTHTGGSGLTPYNTRQDASRKSLFHL